MYLHVGQNTVIQTEDIIGIFDLDKTTVSPRTRAFLNDGQKEGRVVTVGDDLPQSFVVTADGMIFISPISGSTLIKRMKHVLG